MGAYVAIDLHRNRSVILGQAEDGAELGWERIANDPDRLVAEVMRYGENPDVAIEATYGWYWAVDALEAAGANVRLVAPAQVAAFDNRRVKTDLADCRMLADLMRSGVLPEAWIAPPQCRDLRELVRYRAKLVGIRSGFKAQIHAVLAKHGVRLGGARVFDTRAGAELLTHLATNELDGGFAHRVQSLQQLIVELSVHIGLIEEAVAAELAGHDGYQAILTIPGVGPTLAGVFVAEIWDPHRFPSARHLASWAGLTPRHRESDTKVKRGRITKQGDRLVRWAAIQAAHKARGDLADWKKQIAERRGVNNIATVAAARKIVTLVYYGLRDGHIRCLEPAAVA